MAITWSIIRLNYALSQDGHTDVVNNSHWQCIDTDDAGNQARSYGTVSIPTDDLSSFTPYVNITEEQALQWTKDALGADQVAAIEAGVTQKLNLIQNPTEGSGTPWVS